jgi:hypothetical protein
MGRAKPVFGHPGSSQPRISPYGKITTGLSEAFWRHFSVEFHFDPRMSNEAFSKG